MPDKKLVFILGKDGSIKSEAFGFKGPECIKKMEFSHKVFGKPKATELKPSYYEEEVLDQNLDIDGLPSGWCG
jgi:hypothetical protein